MLFSKWYLRNWPQQVVKLLLCMLKLPLQLQQEIGSKISAKYAPGTLTETLLFRRRLTMMCWVLLTYLFLFIISEDIIHEKT